MSRRRELSTDISIDGKLCDLSDRAALLYTWSIPHAEEDSSLKAKTPREMKLLVVPGRDWSVDEMAALMTEILTAELWLREENGLIYFPPETFYKYQSKIEKDRRRKPLAAAPKLPEPAPTGPHGGANADVAGLNAPGSVAASAQNATERHETAPISTERHDVAKVPQKASSSSFSSSYSFSVSEEKIPRSVPEYDDLGLGAMHPAAIAGVDAWNRWVAHCRARGKPPSIYQTELWGKLLAELKGKRCDPVKVVEKAVRRGWADFRELDDDEKEAAPDDASFVSAEDMRRRLHLAKKDTVAA